MRSRSGTLDKYVGLHRGALEKGISAQNSGPAVKKRKEKKTTALNPKGMRGLDVRMHGTKQKGRALSSRQAWMPADSTKAGR